MLHVRDKVPHTVRIDGGSLNRAVRIEGQLRDKADDHMQPAFRLILGQRVKADLPAYSSCELLRGLYGGLALFAAFWGLLGVPVKPFFKSCPAFFHLQQSGDVIRLPVEHNAV